MNSDPCLVELILYHQYLAHSRYPENMETSEQMQQAMFFLLSFTEAPAMDVAVFPRCPRV